MAFPPLRVEAFVGFGKHKMAVFKSPHIPVVGKVGLDIDSWILMHRMKCII